MRTNNLCHKNDKMYIKVRLAKSTSSSGQHFP